MCMVSILMSGSTDLPDHSKYVSRLGPSNKPIANLAIENRKYSEQLRAHHVADIDTTIGTSGLIRDIDLKCYEGGEEAPLNENEYRVVTWFDGGEISWSEASRGEKLRDLEIFKNAYANGLAKAQKRKDILTGFMKEDLSLSIIADFSRCLEVVDKHMTFLKTLTGQTMGLGDMVLKELRMDGSGKRRLRCRELLERRCMRLKDRGPSFL